MTLKLDKLPDREAVKITFTASAELKVALINYADYLNGQHVSSSRSWRKSLNRLHPLSLPRDETLVAVPAVPRRMVLRTARAEGGA